MQDGTELTLRPLAIKPLRKLMKMWEENTNPSEEQKEEDAESLLDFFSRISFECLKNLKATKDKFKDLDDFEMEADPESISRIIKVCMGIDLEAAPKAVETLTRAEEDGAN